MKVQSNLFGQSLVLSQEHDIDIPDTFGELAKKVLHTLPQRAPVHFITEIYIPDSIKSFERDRRLLKDMP